MRATAAVVTLRLMLVLGLALPLTLPRSALAANPPAAPGSKLPSKAIQTGAGAQALAARKLLAKQRAAILGTSAAHAGKTLTGTAHQSARTIVTKRSLPP